MLNSDFDHLSVWEIAHRWHDIDPNTTDPKHLPLTVQDTLRLMCRSLAYADISVCNANGIEKKNPNEHPTFDQFYWDEDFAAEEGADNVDSDYEVPCEDEDDTFISSKTGYNKREAFTDFVERWCAPHYKICEGLDQCYKLRCYDRDKLESVHINQENLINFCRAKRLALPKFWFNDDECKAFDAGYDSDIIGEAGRDINENALKVPLVDLLSAPIVDEFFAKLTTPQRHRLLCRAIAHELWDQDQSITIASMIKHEALLQYGGGRHYTSKNTLRDWIKDVPNRPKNQKGGRPKKQDA